jgi:hypothetical protein
MSSIAIDLAAALSTISRPGDFCIAGTADLLAPRLEVEGVGPIALPLLPVQAEQLIATAERAPYGRGEDTLTDTKVRRTWQIGSERVRIGGRHWPGTLQTILLRAAEGLGVSGPVDAEFYKLLVYDQGSFFVRHRDTEKLPGMFATLILALPSVSAGGELVVRHKDREARLDLRCEDPSEVCFAAFYADCVHEVLPVTSGYRLVLVYNLVWHGRGGLPEPPHYAVEEDVVAGLLKDWAGGPPPPDDASPVKLVYPLEHAYTQAELGFQTLKGADAGKAQIVAAAAERSGCEVHLALVSIEESGSAEHADYPRSRRGWSRDEEDDEFEVVEVTDRTVAASHWRRPDGEPSSLSVIPVKEQEFSPPAALDDLDPDEQHFHEATGNEGASFERTYRRAALVLWPHEWLLAVINQAGLTVALPFLADLEERWAIGGESHKAPLWRQAHELSAHMVATWPMQHWYPGKSKTRTDAGHMLDLLTQLEDVANLDVFLENIAARGGFDLGDSASIVAALRLLPRARAAALMKRLITGAADRSLAACGALLVQATPLGHAVVIGAATDLVNVLPRGPAHETMRDGWRRGREVEPGFVTDLFTAIEPIDAALTDRAVTHMLGLPGIYDFDTVLIPAVRKLLGPRETANSAAMTRLRLACAAHLAARVAEPLEPPRDWTRAGVVGCTCAHCTGLSQYLADPERATWVLRAGEGIRVHVENTIRAARCDVDVTTERQGRPFSLVCTKNQTSYERRRKQRKRDLTDLKRLRG